MGANFPNIRLVLTYLATQTLEAWVQRAGRGARSSDIQCLCIMIVTKSIVQNAIKACKEANIPVDPTLAALKAEALEDEEEDVLARPVDDDTSPGDTPTPSRPSKGAKNGRRVMDLGVSEYIATMDCRTAVLDREFNNPPHISCYEVGGCDRCVERRERAEEADRHIEERQLLKEEAQDRNIEDFEPEEARERKKPTKRDDERFCYGELKKQFTEALTTWRWDKFLELSELYDLTPDWIMTDKELAAIAKTKGLLDATAFDQPAIQWPGRPEWRTEVLDVLAEVQRVEDERLAELDRQQREKEEERERIRMEREARKEQERLEKAAQEQQRAEEWAQRERERAREQEERDRKAAERRARTERRAAQSTASTQQMEATSGGLFTTFLLTPTHATQSTPARAVGTIRICPNGLPSPVTPSMPVLLTPQNASVTNLHAYESLPTPSTSTPSASTSAQSPDAPSSSTPNRHPRRQKCQSGFVFVPYEGPK
ncbi:hypothetical protein FRC11_001812 [Ceratobasidium sp. 423]|nr:hypothetical protein FRC11_001812 [Ceratobasidium sp. 423]